jgi:hypothetical protein
MTNHASILKIHRDKWFIDANGDRIWTAATNKKGKVQVTRDGRMQTVARLTCKEYYGPAPTPKHRALHRTGQRHGYLCKNTNLCVEPMHLYWGADQDNSDDKDGKLAGNHSGWRIIYRLRSLGDDAQFRLSEAEITAGATIQ